MATPNERRQEPRNTVVVDVTLESEHNFYTGLTQDLSNGGLFVATTHILREGEQVRLTFTLPNCKDPIESIAEVRWTRPSAMPDGGGEAGMGLRFLTLTPQAKTSIKAFLRKRESLFMDVD